MDLPADECGQWRAQAERHADVGHDPRALRTCEQVLHHGAADHHAGGAARALQHAGSGECGDVCGQRGHDRGQPSHHQTDHQDGLAPVPVRQWAIHQLQSPIGHHIAAEGQLHIGLAGVKDGAPLLHGGQAQGHGQKAKRNLRQQVGDQPRAVTCLCLAWGARHSTHLSCAAVCKPPYPPSGWAGCALLGRAAGQRRPPPANGFYAPGRQSRQRCPRGCWACHTTGRAGAW
jgi:hypothetical protein